MQPEITPEYLASQGLSATFPERFWKKVNKTDGCWLWTASLHDFGYGQIGRKGHGGTPIHSHVASWVLHNGAVPNQMCVLHRCDNPACIRPDHLFLGTRGDNLRDMTIKGRRVYGERHGRSKLKYSQVLEIRSLYGKITALEIAARFGICDSHVAAIGKNRLWARPARDLQKSACP